MSTPSQHIARPQVNEKTTSLQNSSAELLSLWPSDGQAIFTFFAELYVSKVIKNSVREIFARMNPGVNKELLARYLIGKVCEGMKRDESVFDRFLGVLHKLEGSEKLVCRLKKDVEADSVEEKSGKIYLSEHDVPRLVEILYGISDKWEQVGIALELRQVQIKQIRASSDSLTIKLNSVLCEWMRMSTKENGTLKTLQQALAASKIVERPVIAEILETFREVKRPPSVIPAAESPHSDSTLKVVHQSCDTEVADGKSTLLEVQVSPNESVSYQWLKDGQPLSDGLAYSGVYSDILVISLAKQGSEGKYACHISRDGEEVTSNSITMTVSFPPEKEPLILMYKDLNELPQDSWPPVNAGPFINLALIKKNKQSGSEVYNYSVRGSVDDILESKEKVEYEEVFGQYKCGELVLVEGRPGGGKTTLVNKVARDWARGIDVLKNSKMVFLIPLRNFSPERDGNLSDVLEPFYNDTQMCEQLLSDLQKSQGEGVCFIIDGLDEYQPQDENTSVVYRLIRKNYLRKAMVILASRPMATAPLRDKCSRTRRIEVLGFNQEQIFDYLNMFPFSSDISDFTRSKLREYLHSHPNILHMCYLPVHAAMICFLYEEDNGDIPPTQTKIYEEFTRCVILRMQTRKNENAILTSLRELRGKDKKYFNEICHLAFKMTRNSKQAVCSKEVPFFKRVGLDDAPFLGLITIDHTLKKYGHDNTYIFLHLTLQEYLAAWYIAHLEENEQTEVIRLLAQHGHMQMVWRFYCGMVEFRDKPAQIELIMKNQIVPMMDNQRNFDTTIHHIHCALESQQRVVCDHFFKALHGTDHLKLDHINLTPTNLTAVGYVISTTSHPVRHISIMGCGLQEEHIKAFLMEAGTKELKNIYILDLRHNNIGPDGAVVLASALLSCAQLEQLDLGQNNIGPDGTVSLASALKSCAQLEQLDLRHNNIGPDGAVALASALKSCAKLKQLYVPENYIGPDGAVALASALKSCTQLEQLNLLDNNIGPGGAVALAGALKSCFQLKQLDLTYDNIGPDGAVALASALKSCAQLKQLYLRHNNIGPDGAVALASGLKSCTQLKHLYLRHNNIGPDGAVALASALKSCAQLKQMDLTFNNVGPDGAVALASALKSCTQLEQLNLFDNNIGSDGAVALASALKSCAQLKQLVLTYNNIGPDGAVALASALKSCAQLKHLDLKRNSIGSNGAVALAGALESCAQLEQVDLTFNNIGRDGAVALAHALESCGELRKVMW